MAGKSIVGSVAKKDDAEILEVAGRQVRISHPGKVYFPDAGFTKMDLVRYYESVGPAALRAIHGRPIVLKRYVDGIGADAFFQKRAPESRPDWIETVTLAFPSGRTADEVVVTDLAQLLWMVNLGCVDLNPHPVRASDLDHPDELRLDLDPGPGVPFDDVRRTALVIRDVLGDHGLAGWPKTSGSRGIHVYVRIERRWGFDELRRAALAVAREAERREPSFITSKWWKEERHGVFIDYNQNAKDRTVASAYSVRATPGAWVSAPLTWDEVPRAELSDHTLRTVPERYARLGDLMEGMDAAPGSLDGLLELSARQEAAGQGDAPWPPHYRKQSGEPPRVQPSKRRGTSRRSTMPLIVISKAAKKEDALAGLERWRARHPAAAAQLAVDDVLVDAMRGRYKTWTRIRVNLRHVPEAERPPEEPPDPDYDPWEKMRESS
ncbi:MAG: non-homologous end-joining DNA ligase [Acidobacteriota bacterium]